MAFTGMRAGEVLQLQGRDVRNATNNFGRWVRGRAGLKESKRQPTHGFRHRMEDELGRAGVL
jgi:hypothetical protein